MTIEEIMHGESKYIEFKRELPSDSEKYVKTIIAFANTQGGQLIVGVEDKTRTIVGVDNEAVFKIMDQIANAVSASCTPQIVPNITFQSIEGKTIITVSVSPGTYRPYYFKSKGKEHGTYIRVAGTSRLADPDKIRELEYEGARVSWDEQTCVGYQVTDNLVKKLCRDINRYRKEMKQLRGMSSKQQKVTETQLENWGLIKRSDDEKWTASNAFALLTGERFPYAKTQCAVFAGKERITFIDKRDFTGPLYEQIEEAFDFVLRNIRIRAKVEGLIRRERYELPPDAIREMIINAHCHRSYLEPASVQVAVFEDRLEVTSPGGLYFGLTLKEALEGHSKQRNRAIAEVFYQMGLIEAWGTGLKKIQQEAKAYKLAPPSFIESGSAFRINLYRQGYGPDLPSESSGENLLREDQSFYDYAGGSDFETEARQADYAQSDLLQGTKKQILSLIRIDSRISAAAIAGRIGLTSRAVEKNIKQLRDAGILVRVGPAKGGYWKINL